MAQTTIHHGPSASIPTDGASASPGLLFLKRFLAVLDSLVPEEVQTLTEYLAPGATFAINGGAPGKQLIDFWQFCFLLRLAIETRKLR